MKKHTLLYMAVCLLTDLAELFLAIPVQAQDTHQYALYNYRNDGNFNAWLNIDVDSITYSCIDTLGVEHEDIVVQEVWTQDNVYRIPIEAIDSIGFRAPVPVMREGLFYLRNYHAEHTTAVDSLTLYFDTSIHRDSLPAIGQVVLNITHNSPFEDGFGGRVSTVRQKNNSIEVVCEMICVGDVYKRLVLVGKSLNESAIQNTPSLARGLRKRGSDYLSEFEESNVKTFKNIGDLKFSCLDGIISIISKDPTLIVSYYVYVDELFYSMSAELNFVHHDLETKLSLSLSKIEDLAKTKKDVSDAMKRLRDFKNVDQWLEDIMKEKIDAENKEKESEDEINIIEELWKDAHISKSIPLAGPLLLDFELGPLLKFKGDIETVLTLKTKARNTFHLQAKGITAVTLSNPQLALLTGAASIKGNATFDSDPFTNGSFDINAKGTLSAGITGKVGLSLIHKDVVHVSLSGEGGIKGSAALDIKYVDTEVDRNDWTPYEAIKDTKIKLELFAKAGVELGVTPSKFFSIGEEWEFFSKNVGTWYLFPHFSEPSMPRLINGQWSNGNSNNHLILQSLPTKEIPDVFLGPCEVGLRIADSQGNVIRSSDDRDYLDDNTLTWQLYPLEIDLSGLTPGETYRCYPVLSYFGWKKMKATPSHEFTVPFPMSTFPKQLTLSIGGSQIVEILDGWDTFAIVISGDEKVASIVNDDETDARHIKIIGKKVGNSELQIEDRRTGEKIHVPITVTDKANELLDELGLGFTHLDMQEDEGYGLSIDRVEYLSFESTNPTVATAAVNDDVGETHVIILAHSVGTAIVTIIDTETRKKSQVEVQVSERTEFGALVGIGETEEVVMKNKNGIYEAYCEDNGIAICEVVENRILVTGIKSGETIIHVTEKKEGKQFSIRVVVHKSGGNPDDGTAYLSCPDDNHPHMIDLGLPSGTKWACCNLGALKPEDFGGYYAWGETEEKDSYTWSNYIHCDGSEETCHDIGQDITGTVFDAANANWGSSWQQPTVEQWQEVFDNCTSQWTSENGIYGRKLIGHNGGTIFLPAAGWIGESSSQNVNESGHYWSSLHHVLHLSWGIAVYFDKKYPHDSFFSTVTIGSSIRPVYR